jgi:predicted nucleotidyltransferase
MSSFVDTHRMSDQRDWHTPHLEVSTVLEALLGGARAVLGDRFVGLSLYGSLASGDFNPQTSDIDFVVVTDIDLPEGTISDLETLHARLWNSGLKWAAKLEGAYVPLATLRRHDPEAAPCPVVNEGQFYRDRLGSDWIIQRYILREYGAALCGPPLQAAIDPVTPDDIRRAVIGVLREWWQPMLADPKSIRNREYEAYAALTMCRALYALEEGAIVSKPVAARWALHTLDDRWAALIDRALAWPQAPQPGRLNETLDLIRYTIERARLIA